MISFICCWIAEADCFLKWTCHQSHWPHHISARGLGRRTECRYFSPRVLLWTHIHRVTSWLLRSGIIVWIVTEYNWKKSFTHIEHRAEAVGREGLVNLIPVLTPEYLLPVLVDSSPPSYLFTSATVRLHQSVKQNLSNLWRFIFEIGAEQLRPITEIAPKSPVVCEQKSYIKSSMIFVRAKKPSRIVWTYLTVQ